MSRFTARLRPRRPRLPKSKKGRAGLGLLGLVALATLVGKAQSYLSRRTYEQGV